MLKIIHRVNTIKELRQVPHRYGVEVDVRTNNKKLILNHEPFQDGELLEEYLKEFNHTFIILEIKEEGIEKEVIRLCKKYNVENYFLLNVSFPFIYLLSNERIKKIAVRFSEFEDINTALSLKNKVEWIWVDVFTKNPLTKDIYKKIKKANFKICLVCPERWGRERDIPIYIEQMKRDNILVDAVMTSLKNAKKWL